MKTRVVNVLLVCFSMVSPVSLAADLEEEVVVTATRTPTAIEKLPTSVTLINREDIEALQVTSLPQLLSGIAGVDVTNSGGYGKTTGIRIRGTESDHVLVMLDGVRIGSATLGTAAFQHIPVTQIDRIEIVRGPHSSLWGSEAFGGVIHIFTRKGSGDTPLYALDVGGGSFETFEVTGGVSGEYNNFNYSGAVSYFDSQGIDARQPTPAVDQPDKDGYDNISVHFRGGYDFGDLGEIEAFILHAEGDTEFDGSFQDNSDFVQQVVGGNLLLQPLNNWTTQLRLSQSKDKLDSFLGDTFSSRFNTQRRQLSWQNDVKLSDQHDITFGIDYRDDKIDSNTVFNLASKDTIGVYGQYSGNYHGHQIIASVRWDDDEIFGSETTGSIGWSYKWQDWLRMYASYGTAYKAPTFNELFFPNFGNPNLMPEAAQSYEAGLEGVYDWLRWGIAAYHTDIDDMIIAVNVFDQNGFFLSSSAQNVNKANITGLEGELEVNWQDWQARLAAEYLDPEDEDTGNRLARRVKKRLTFDLKHDMDEFSFAVRVLAEGDRFNDFANFVQVGGFVTLDLLAEYRFNQQITLSAKVANLLDKDYETVDTFNSFDRNFFVSVRYRSR